MSFFPPPPRGDPKQNNPNFQAKQWNQKQRLEQSRRSKGQKHESDPSHWKSQRKSFENGFHPSNSDKVGASGMELDEQNNPENPDFPFDPSQFNPPKWNHQKPRFQGRRSSRLKYQGNQDETNIPLHIIIPVLVGSAILILLIAVIIFKCCKKSSDESEAQVCDFASTPGFMSNQKMHSADNLDNFAERQQKIVVFPYLQAQIGYPKKKAAAYEIYDSPNGGALPFNSFRPGNYNEYPQFYV